jgi:toxin ParE1/3/4
MKYSVEITDSAYEAILAHARYIAVDCQAPLNASRWLEKLWDAIDALEQMPERHNLAPESAYKNYEVRRVLLGDYMILFTIDQPARKVWVIGFRHGSRLARPRNLPEEQPSESKE